MSTIHNPSQFNPADYTVIDYFDNKPPQAEYSGNWSENGAAAFAILRDQWLKEREELFPEQNCYRCEHCGQTNVRWVVSVRHNPTGKHVCFGNECAFRLEFATRGDFRAAQVQQRSEARAANIRRLIERERFIAATPGLVELLARAEKSTNSFVRDVVAKLNRYGSLSPAQISAVGNALDRDERRAVEKASEPQPTTPAPEGRAVVTGLVLTVKEQEGFYGTTFKALIRLTDHNKVWVTQPSGSNFERGWTVTLRASWTRSDKDAHFSFGSRPHLISERAPAELAAVA